MTYHVYALRYPDTMLPFYIGSTKRPKQRFKEHLRAKTPVAKYEIICELKTRGLVPVMDLLLVTDDLAEAIQMESKQIDLHAEHVINAVNIHIEPPHSHCPAHIGTGNQAECLRCGKIWTAIVPYPRSCPQCHSYQWDEYSIYDPRYVEESVSNDHVEKV